MQAMGGNVEASLNNEVTVVVAKDMTLFSGELFSGEELLPEKSVLGQ